MFSVDTCLVTLRGFSLVLGLRTNLKSFIFHVTKNPEL
jgi:hypothetical protein